MRSKVWLLVGLLLGVSHIVAEATEITIQKDPESGFEVHTIRQGGTIAKVCPDAGCNVYSITVNGKEILKTPKSLKDLPGFMYGNPICYPTPNRVNNAEFTWNGKSYKFPVNNGKNFLHGLVHSAPFETAGQITKNGRTSMQYKLVFKPGTKWFELFPFEHTLWMVVAVEEGAVSFEYAVDNHGKEPLPFGFCYHPWFLYQGSRKDTYLSVPATHVFEVSDPSPTGLIPTGKLLDLQGHPHDLRTARTLENFVIDDVFFGMRPEAPAVMEFRDKNMKITMRATPDFTHAVVYTPKDEGWFCVENQTCSTDAHNLFGRGLKKEAHLIVVAPGERHTGTAEYIVSP